MIKVDEVSCEPPTSASRLFSTPRRTSGSLRTFRFDALIGHVGSCVDFGSCPGTWVARLQQFRAEAFRQTWPPRSPVPLLLDLRGFLGWSVAGLSVTSSSTCDIGRHSPELQVSGNACWDVQITYLAMPRSAQRLGSSIRRALQRSGFAPRSPCDPLRKLRRLRAQIKKQQYRPSDGRDREYSVANEPGILAKMGL